MMKSTDIQVEPESKNTHVKTAMNNYSGIIISKVFEHHLMPITTTNRRTRIIAICKFTHEAKNLLEFTSNIPWLKFTENVTRHNVDMMIAIRWWPTGIPDISTNLPLLWFTNLFDQRFLNKEKIEFSLWMQASTNATCLYKFLQLWHSPITCP